PPFLVVIGEIVGGAERPWAAREPVRPRRRSRPGVTHRSPGVTHLACPHLAHRSSARMAAATRAARAGRRDAPPWRAHRPGRPRARGSAHWPGPPPAPGGDPRRRGPPPP